MIEPSTQDKNLFAIPGVMEMFFSALCTSFTPLRNGDHNSYKECGEAKLSAVPVIAIRLIRGTGNHFLFIDSLT